MWWHKFILVYFGILWVVLAVGNHGSKLVTAICYAICNECEGKTHLSNSLKVLTAVIVTFKLSLWRLLCFV